MGLAGEHPGLVQGDLHIRRLWPSDMVAYRAHLLRLEEDARYSRFGTVVSTDIVAAHTIACCAPDTFVFGAFYEGKIRGVVELHLLDPRADIYHRAGEAAFSVEKAFRHGGLGSALAERAIQAARNRGLRFVVLSCLSQNFAMQNLARKYGATLLSETDEVTGKIEIELPTPQTVLAEFVEDSLDFAAALFALQQQMFRTRAHRTA